MNASYKEIKRYMQANVEDLVDWKTNEVNMTTLAEDACSHFHDYENDDFEINQRYFDIAYEVGISKEKELNER